MKRNFVIILLLFSIAECFSQSIPQDYLVSNKINLSKSVQNISNKVIGFQRFNVLPTPSSTIISNFISDIITISNPAGDTIWFGTGKGLSRTTNRGVTFENFYGLAPFGEDDVSGIDVYKNWIVVSTAVSQLINDEQIPTGTGIKVSSDYGVTWSAYPQPVDQRYDTTIVYGNQNIYALDIVVTQQNLSYDILIAKKNRTSDSLIFWITSWAGELRKSIDFGATFKRVLLPPDNLDSIYPGGGPYNFRYDPNNPPVGNDNHKCFAICSENDSTYFVGTANGINKSTDWGVSWRKFSYANTGSGAGVSGDFVVALKVQSYSGRKIIWAASNPATSGGVSGLSYSTNSGANWNNTLSTTVEGFSHDIGFKDSIVFGATDEGIWRSYFSSSFSWSKPSIIYDETIRDRIYSLAFYSVDSQGDSVWVGSGDGLARTIDTVQSPWVGKWKIFRAYREVTSTNETYAAPNPFSPKDEVVRIFFKTGKTSSDVTVRVFDFGMSPVRTVVQNANRQDPNMLWVVWDGKRNDGSQAANGIYFYRIEVDKDLTFWGKILLLQ